MSALALTEKHVVLCHGNCDLTATIFRPNPKHGTTRLKVELENILKFLKKNSEVVLTIVFEDLLKDKKVLKEVFNEVDGLMDVIYTKQDYRANGSKWPTIGEMRAKDKRLVIFVSKIAGTPDFAFHKWTYMVENQYSTLNLDNLLKVRGESKSHRKKQRKLYELNTFAKFPIPLDKPASYYANPKNIPNAKKALKWENDSTAHNGRILRECIKGFYEKGLWYQGEPRKWDYQGSYPNLLHIDYVNKGNPIETANYINIVRRLGMAPTFKDVKKTIKQYKDA